MARHHHAADINGDGAVTQEDYDMVTQNLGNFGVGNINRSGTVDSRDQSLANDSLAALPPGEISKTDNIVGYAGYLFNAEIHGAGMYTVRHRHYAPDLGRWLTRDPIGYVDGMNLYEYVRSQPFRFTDPAGLFCQSVTMGWPIGVGGEGESPVGPTPAGTPPSQGRWGIGSLSAQWSLSGGCTGERCLECCDDGTVAWNYEVREEGELSVTIGFSPWRFNRQRSGYTIGVWIAAYNELGFFGKFSGGFAWGGCGQQGITGKACGTGSLQIGVWGEVRAKTWWGHVNVSFGAKLVGTARGQASLCIECTNGSCCTTFQVCGSLSGSVRVSLFLFDMTFGLGEVSQCLPEEILGYFKYPTPF